MECNDSCRCVGYGEHRHYRHYAKSGDFALHTVIAIDKKVAVGWAPPTVMAGDGGQCPPYRIDI